ncbi:MAG: hypothetical protein IJF92_06145 [Bacilli bacterium]|nr:hypothetical protein [Bacilli bacterium]
MKKIKGNDLEKICGGTTTISSAVVNAFTNIIKLLLEAGHDTGSAVRRIGEGNLCPLE